MTSKEWFCLALRLFGVWLLLQSLQEFVPSLFYALSAFGSGQGFPYWSSMAIWFLLRTGLAIVFLLFAPAISSRFYGTELASEPAVQTTPSSESNALKVGIQLLAVYALLLGLQALSGVVLGMLSGVVRISVASIDYGSAEYNYMNSLLTCGLNFGFALLLIIWNTRIISFIERVRYVPERDAYESIPVNEADSTTDES